MKQKFIFFYKTDFLRWAYVIYEWSLSTRKLYCRCLWNKEKQDKTLFTAPDCDNGIVYAVFEFPTLFRNYRRINSFAHLFSGYHCFFNFIAVKTFKNVCGYASLLPIWLWPCFEIVNLLKSLLRTDVFNYVKAAPFSVSFFQLPAVKKHQKRCSCDVIKDVHT